MHLLLKAASIQDYVFKYIVDIKQVLVSKTSLDMNQ